MFIYLGNRDIRLRSFIFSFITDTANQQYLRNLNSIFFLHIYTNLRHSCTPVEQCLTWKLANENFFLMQCYCVRRAKEGTQTEGV
jgi:hypothetical protein